MPEKFLPLFIRCPNLYAIKVIVLSALKHAFEISPVLESSPVGISMATFDLNSLHTDRISSSCLLSSILPPIPNIASIITVSIEIFFSSLEVINFKFLAFLNACSHK